MHNRPQNPNNNANNGLPGTDLSKDPSLVDWVAVDVVLPAPSLTCSNTGPAPPPRALPPPASDGDDWLPALPPALKAGANCPAVRYAGVNMPRRPPGRPMSTPLSSLPPSPSLLQLWSLRSLELPPRAICSMLGAADAANHRSKKSRWRWGGGGRTHAHTRPHTHTHARTRQPHAPLLPPETCTLRPKETSALTGTKTGTHEAIPAETRGLPPASGDVRSPAATDGARAAPTAAHGPPMPPPMWCACTSLGTATLKLSASTPCAASACAPAGPSTTPAAAGVVACA